MSVSITYGDCAEADAAERVQIFLRFGVEVCDDQERAGHVRHGLVIKSLQVRHAGAVVAERVSEARTSQGHDVLKR